MGPSTLAALRVLAWKSRSLIRVVVQFESRQFESSAQIVVCCDYDRKSPQAPTRPRSTGQEEVYLAGDAIALDLPPIQTQGVSTFSYRFWQDMYDQERVKALGAEGGAIRHIEAA